MLLGAHISVAGGIHRAIQKGNILGCTSIQIFTRSQLRWNSPPLPLAEIELYKRERIRSHVKKVVAHGSYLLNLASPDKMISTRSIDTLIDELYRCETLEIPSLVIHPGSHMGYGETLGIKRVIKNIRSVFEGFQGGVTLCIETTAGQGTNLGSRFEQIAEILYGVGDNKLASCIDTCHIFAAGYDIRSKSEYEKTIHDFDTVVGLQTVQVIHLNDSKGTLGSRIDRHMHIGRGMIGLDAFSFIMNDERFERVPKIIETPKEKDSDNIDRMNLEVLKSLVH